MVVSAWHMKGACHAHEQGAAKHAEHAETDNRNVHPALGLSILELLGTADWDLPVISSGVFT